MLTKINPSDYRVMLVDDDPTSLLTVQSILAAEGYQVTGTSDSAAASDRVGAPDYDILIADYKMPGVDGLTLVRRSKLLRPDAMRLMLTGVGDYEVALAAINQAEVYRFMTKPVDEVELRINVRLASEHLSLVREVQRLRREMDERDRLLARLEAHSPGITQTHRRADGAIVLDDSDLG